MDTIIAENLLLVCSICLDSIANHEERSVANLKCGHQFHLDCIGSAFNVKGAMVCPNCRKIEDGTWLYANGSAPSLSDFSIDEGAFDEDQYEYLFAEDPSGLPWCPFSGLAGVHSTFEQVESPPTPNREYLGNHAIFAEHMAASPMAHSHVHVLPIPSAISNAANVQYESWGLHSPQISANRNHLIGVDHVSYPSTLRITRVDADAISRSGPSALPFSYGDTSSPRGRNLFVSSLNHPGSITRPHERIQVSNVGHPSQGYPTSLISPIMPGVERFSGPRGMPVLTPAPTQSGFNIFPHSGGQNLHEENRDHLFRFPVMSFNRDPGWESHQQASGGSDSSRSSDIFWPEWS